MARHADRHANNTNIQRDILTDRHTLDICTDRHRIDILDRRTNRQSKR